MIEFRFFSVPKQMPDGGDPDGVYLGEAELRLVGELLILADVISRYLR